MENKNILAYAVPVFLLLIVVEILISIKTNKELYDKKDAIASILVGFGVGFISLVGNIWGLFVFSGVFELFNPIHNGVRMNWLGYEPFKWSALTLFGGYLLSDFFYYWFHRSNHEIRILWAGHVAHHSSERYNLTTAVRNAWATPFVKPFFYMFLAVFGFEPMMIFMFISFDVLWQFQQHTQLIPRIKLVESFLVTHKFHYTHHCLNVELLDKNHGSFLNIYDRLFGTYVSIDDAIKIDTQLGVMSPPNSYNPLVIVSHEYVGIIDDLKKAKTWKERFMYVFGPPGWSPDGSRKTVKQLQREWKQNIEQNPHKREGSDLKTSLVSETV